jgi:hypothetical protein
MIGWPVAPAPGADETLTWLMSIPAQVEDTSEHEKLKFVTADFAVESIEKL